jgi:hypothetical protein
MPTGFQWTYRWTMFGRHGAPLWVSWRDRRRDNERWLSEGCPERRRQYPCRLVRSGRRTPEHPKSLGYLGRSGMSTLVANPDKASQAQYNGVLCGVHRGRQGRQGVLDAKALEKCADLIWPWIRLGFGEGLPNNLVWELRASD